MTGLRLTYAEGAALVAGGSGGIGSAIAQTLGRAGLPVALTYRTGREAAERLVAELAARGAVARAYAWSAGPGAEAQALVQQVAREIGPLRHLVIATGIPQSASFPRLEEAAWRELIETNLAGPLALARAAITPMMKAGVGRIVFIGSVAGGRGIQGLTVYSATKAGLEALARSLAREAGPFGVTVNCVAPGFVDTPMLRGSTERAREEWTRRIPVGRLARPAEIADVVAFVLSGQAAYLTGQTLVVDGGVSL
jgi:3-oxoacyl-[acyl-carrier protein] reductase